MDINSVGLIGCLWGLSEIRQLLGAGPAPRKVPTRGDSCYYYPWPRYSVTETELRMDEVCFKWILPNLYLWLQKKKRKKTISIYIDNKIRYVGIKPWTPLPKKCRQWHWPCRLPWVANTSWNNKIPFICIMLWRIPRVWALPYTLGVSYTVLPQNPGTQGFLLLDSGPWSQPPAVWDICLAHAKTNWCAKSRMESTVKDGFISSLRCKRSLFDLSYDIAMI